VVVNDLGISVNGQGSSKEFADSVCAEIKSKGGVAVANYDTVATPDGGENIIKTAINNFGKIDILVNNAGIEIDNAVTEMTEWQWDTVIKTNLYGTFYCTKPAARFMCQQRSGRIINMASLAALGTVPESPSYSASKGGMLAFTRAVAKDLGPYGITVNAVLPLAKTRMFDMTIERVQKQGFDVSKWSGSLSPESIAPLVVFFASDEASNINGCSLAYRQKGTIQLYSDPIPVNSIYKDGEWTAAELVHVIPSVLTAGLANPAPPHRK
jgi:NAD(P)-dependent dehydrogenase (short-subunit alcohol dehydrogenase family)